MLKKILYTSVIGLFQPVRLKLSEMVMCLILSPAGTLIYTPYLLYQLYIRSNFEESIMLTVYAPFFALLCIYLIFLVTVFPFLLITHSLRRTVKRLNIFTILLSYLGFSYYIGAKISPMFKIENMMPILVFSTPMVILYLFLIIKFNGKAHRIAE